MEPMFEGLFVRDGRSVRRAMGLDREPPGWPAAKQWSDRERSPSRTPEEAIDAMRELRPKPPIRRVVHSIYKEGKDEWCDYLLRRLLADPTQAAEICAHPIARRLAHLLPPV
jgi:hypothetical protein